MPEESSILGMGKRKFLLAVGILTISIVIITVTACVVGLYVSSFAEDDSKIWKGNGTTRNIKDIILGRCYDYLIKKPELGHLDCKDIWEEFTNVLYWKDPCKIERGYYHRLMELTRETLPCNMSLFWSKTNGLAHRYTKVNEHFRTLEDTFLGYIFNNLRWCGKAHSAGMDFKSCPVWGECENQSMSSFWKEASAAFAKSSCGVVQVLLNGSKEGVTFRNDSIFTSIEIPNMNPNSVSEVRLWLAHGIDGPPRSTCSNDSVMELKHYIEQHNLRFSCADNEKSIQLLQCIENPGAAACMNYN